MSHEHSVYMKNDRIHFLSSIEFKYSRYKILHQRLRLLRVCFFYNLKPFQEFALKGFRTHNIHVRVCFQTWPHLPSLNFPNHRNLVLNYPSTVQPSHYSLHLHNLTMKTKNVRKSTQMKMFLREAIVFRSISMQSNSESNSHRVELIYRKNKCL